MLFVATGTGIVGCEKSRLAVAIVHLSQVRRTSHDVVVRIIRIRTQAVAQSQFSPCPGHDLHQAHGAFGRQGAHVTTTFSLHDGANPGRRDCKSARGFLYEARDVSYRRNAFRMLAGDWFGIGGIDGAHQENGDSAACAESPTDPQQEPLAMQLGPETRPERRKKPIVLIAPLLVCP